MGWGKYFLLFPLFMCALAQAESIEDYPGWMMDPIAPEDESAFVLGHQDGRAAISIPANIADQIRRGAMSPEQVYLSRTRNLMVQEGQALGNSGLSVPNEMVYSAAQSEARMNAANGNSNNTNSGGARNPGSLMGLGSVGSTQGSVNNNFNKPAGSTGTSGAGSTQLGPTNYNGANSNASASPQLAPGQSANGVVLHQAPTSQTAQNAQGAQATNTQQAGSAAQAAAAKTAQAYYQQYFGGASGGTGVYIPYDTNSGQYDPNIAAGSAASLQQIQSKAGKYAPK